MIAGQVSVRIPQEAVLAGYSSMNDSLSQSKEPRPPAPSSTAVSRVMRANRGKGTHLELALRRALRRSGVRGYRLNDRRLPGTPDFSFSQARVAVFANGCFWHGHEVHERAEPKTHAGYWSAKIARNKERDRRNERDLYAMGWTVFVVWECELYQDSAKAIAPIVAVLGIGATERRGSRG